MADRKTERNLDELGRLLRQERQRRGQTIRAAAKAAREHVDYLGRLERGTMPEPSADRLAKIADYYGINRNELFRLAGFKHLATPATSVAAEGLSDEIREILNRALTDFEKTEMIRHLGILRGTHLTR